jgi:hypothetical protein
MSKLNDELIRKIFSPPFVKNSVELQNIGEYLRGGFVGGDLEERVKEKNYEYKFNNDVYKRDVSGDEINMVVLFYFINMGSHIHKMLNKKEITREIIDDVYIGTNFDISFDDNLTTGNINQKIFNDDYMEPVLNKMAKFEDYFKKKYILEGGSNMKLKDFISYGFTYETNKNQRNILAYFHNIDKYFPYKLQYITLASARVPPLASVHPISPTQPPPRPPSLSGYELPTIQQAQQAQQAQQPPSPHPPVFPLPAQQPPSPPPPVFPLPAQQPPSPPPPVFPLPAQQPPATQPQFIQPPTVNPRDTPLLMYELPSKRVVKYDSNKQSFEAHVGKEQVDFAGEDENCFGTGYKTCNTLTNMLTPGNNQMFDDLKDGRFDFNTNIIRNITRMNPTQAVLILNNFGVEKVTVDGRERYQTIREWLNSLRKKGIQQDVIDKISGNGDAIVYLDALIDYVNGIPNYLNPVSQSQESSSQYLRSLGIKPLPPMKLIETQHRTGDTLLQMANVLKQRHILSSNPMLHHPFAVHVLPRPQFGGGEKSNKLRFIINGLIKDLESRGKRLSDKDRTALMSNLDILEQLEDNLEKIAQKLTQYRGWSDTIPDRSPEVVSVGSVEDKIAKYKDCVRQQQKLESGLLDAAERLNRCLKS